MAASDIKYFVFMKAETTGRQWRDSDPTKIVELSLIAVNSKDLQSGMAKKMPAAQKLTMVFCPERGIQESATDSHDITVEYVENAITFQQSAKTIIAFLEQLPKPVCLVAHGGVSFDFKHLKAEIISADVTLPEDLLCVDSMWVFFYILKEESEVPPKKVMSLQKLYEMLFNESPNPVTAEDKALLLLDCALHNKSFLKFAGMKCKLLSEVKLVGECKLMDFF